MKMTKQEERFFPIKRLCFQGHECIRKILCGNKTTRQERRALRVLKRAMQYLHALEPDTARWDREK